MSPENIAILSRKGVGLEKDSFPKRTVTRAEVDALFSEQNTTSIPTAVVEWVHAQERTARHARAQAHEVARMGTMLGTVELQLLSDLSGASPEDILRFRELPVAERNEEMARLSERALGAIAKNPEIFTTQIHLLLEKFSDHYKEIDQHDRMTRLLTRQNFIAKGVDMMKQCENAHQPMAVISLDVDFFKIWNTLFGYRAGDVMLELTAHCLDSFAQERGGEAGRMGGEEFSLILQGMSNGMPLQQLEVLRERIAARTDFFIDGLQRAAGDTCDIRQELFRTMALQRKDALDITMVHGKREEAYRAFLEKMRLAGMIDGAADTLPLPSKVFEILDRAVKEQVSDPSVHNLMREYVRLFPLGTVTIGGISVDFAQANENTVSENDLNFLDTLLAHTDSSFQEKEFRPYMKGYSSFREYVQSKDRVSYLSLRRKMSDRVAQLQGDILNASHGDGEVLRSYIAIWDHIITRFYEQRFGRLVRKADARQEEQKAMQRDTISIEEKKNIADFDHAPLMSGEQEVKGHIREALLPMQENLRAKLSDMKSNLLADLPERDQRIVLFSRIYRRLQHAYTAMRGTLDADADIALAGAYTHICESLQHEYELVKSQFISEQDGKYIETKTDNLNNNYYDGIVSHQIQEAYRDGKDYTIVAFDFDYLKACNTAGGRFLGDYVLQKSAVQFREALQSAAPEARLIRVSGGEEFLIAFPGMTSDRAAQIVTGINQQLQESFRQDFEKIMIQNGNEPQSLYDLIQHTIHTEYPHLTPDECKKFGSVTACALNIQDIRTPEGNAERLDTNTLRTYAESVVGKLKKTEQRPGSTYRGSVVTLGESLEIIP